MVAIFDVRPQKLAEEVASQLKGKLEQPKWAQFVKTGVHKQRPPVNQNWFYIRAASVLKTLYEDGPVGVSKLRSKYGGKKNRGVSPPKFQKASGNIIRKILQQLDKAGLSKYQKEGVHKGRIITPQGISLLTKAAEKIAKQQ
ncbi:MAG: 30S ribosomal protein S19e [DPANN group archaeon]|nr:30S ribosomal protein S19e [DPANN group archaeon]